MLRKADLRTCAARATDHRMKEKQAVTPQPAARTSGVSPHAMLLPANTDSLACNLLRFWSRLVDQLIATLFLNSKPTCDACICTLLEYA